MDFVRDLMTPDPICVGPDTPLATCAERMLTHGVRHLPVVDDGGLVGLLTDASVFGRGRYDQAKWTFLDERADVAALPAFTLREDAPAVKGIRKLVGRDAAVVVDEAGSVVGILSEHDAVRLAPAVLPAFKKVHEIASSPVFTVMAHATALEAWDGLRDRGHRHVVVTDPRGVATDVLSLRDLVRSGLRPDDPRRVSQVCTQTALHTIDGRATVQEAARKMADLSIGCLPSVDELGAPISILTRSDVLGLLADTLEDEALFGTPGARDPRLEMFPLIRALRGPSPHAALRSLLDGMARHFAGEEAPNEGLYVRLLAQGCPEPVVEGFRFQHRALLDELAVVARLDPVDQEWKHRLIHFANELEAHEFEESRAVLRSCDFP